MASYYVNNNKIDRSDFSNVQEAFDYFQTENPQLIFTRILIDGDYVELDDEAKVLLSQPDLDTKITFEAKTKEGLLIEAINSCGKYIDIISAQILALTELYNKNETAKADTAFAECIELLDLFIQLIISIQANYKALNKSSNIKNLQNLEIHLLSVLKALVNAKEKKDIVMLCDLLEYELIDNLTQWKIQVLPELKKIEKQLLTQP